MTERERRMAALEQRIARLPADDDETDDDRRRRFDVLVLGGEPDPIRDAGFDWEAARVRFARALNLLDGPLPRRDVGSDGAPLGCDGRRVVGNHP